MSRETLPDEVKLFIVQALASFDKPSIVVKAVKEDFGLVVTPQQVQAYDPTKVAGQDLSQKWREVFEATRKAYLDNTAEVAIAQRSVRLRMLDRMAAKAEIMGNMGLAATILEQAAKEAGGAFTNRREVSGPDGKPIQAEVVTLPDLSRLSQSERDALRPFLEGLAGESEGGAQGA